MSKIYHRKKSSLCLFSDKCLWPSCVANLTDFQQPAGLVKQWRQWKVKPPSPVFITCSIFKQGKSLNFWALSVNTESKQNIFSLFLANLLFFTAQNNKDLTHLTWKVPFRGFAKDLHLFGQRLSTVAKSLNRLFIEQTHSDREDP